jgi:hypothetical protein
MITILQCPQSFHNEISFISVCLLCARLSRREIEHLGPQQVAPFACCSRSTGGRVGTRAHDAQSLLLASSLASAAVRFASSASAAGPSAADAVLRRGYKRAAAGPPHSAAAPDTPRFQTGRLHNAPPLLEEKLIQTR